MSLSKQRSCISKWQYFYLNQRIFWKLFDIYNATQIKSLVLLFGMAIWHQFMSVAAGWLSTTIPSATAGIFHAIGAPYTIESVAMIGFFADHIEAGF